MQKEEVEDQPAHAAADGGVDHVPFPIQLLVSGHIAHELAGLAVHGELIGLALVIRGQQPVPGAQPVAAPSEATSPFPPAQEPASEGASDDLPF